MLTEHDLGHVIDRLLDTTLHMSQVLQELKVTPEELAEWSRRPRVREALDALTALWRLRTDLLAAEGSSDAMLTMIELARCAERHSPELARRAAAAILKHTPSTQPVAQAFQPVPTSPTPPTPSSPSPTPPPRWERGPGGGLDGHTTQTPRPETPSPPAPLPSRKGLGEGSDDHTSPTTSTSDPSSPTPPPSWARGQHGGPSAPTSQRPRDEPSSSLQCSPLSPTPATNSGTAQSSDSHSPIEPQPVDVECSDPVSAPGNTYSIAPGAASSPPIVFTACARIPKTAEVSTSTSQDNTLPARNPSVVPASVPHQSPQTHTKSAIREHISAHPPPFA